MIDRHRLLELRDEIGADVLGEVATLFFEETAEVVTRMSAAMPTDTKDLRESLHFLKGSAMNLGLRQFAQLCQELEARSRQGVVRPADLHLLADTHSASRTPLMVAIASKAPEGCPAGPH